MTTNKVKSHSTRSLLCLILFRKNIFCRGQSLDACYQRFMTKGCKYATKCQCPLGLIPHFYLKVMVLKPLKKPVSMPSRAYTSFLHLHLCVIQSSQQVCQCPLGLIPHFYLDGRSFLKQGWTCVNALSGLYLISTVPLQKPRFYAVSRACFCRYLSEYSDNSCFSCMLTFWTYLMRCTYP